MQKAKTHETECELANENQAPVSENPVAGPLAVFLVVFVLLSLFVPKFFTLRSVSGILNAATLSGTLTVGVALLMIAGEFDLSVGSQMAVGGYIFASLAMSGQPVLGAFLALLATAVLGSINGIILVTTGIPSFIVTLGTKYFYRGMLWVISAGTMLQTVEKLDIYKFFNAGWIFSMICSLGLTLEHR